MANLTDTFYSAADAAKHGYGAQFEVGDGDTPETFQAVAYVKVITPGNVSTADVLTTHLRSTGAHHEHRAGMRDSEAFQIEGIWVPTDESQSTTGGGSGSFTGGGLMAMWADRQNRNFKIVLPDNEGSPSVEWPFRGYVASFQPGSITIDDEVIGFTASIQPTGAYDQDLP